MLKRALTIVLIAVLMTAGLELPARAATGTIAPFPKHQFFDANGNPCNACLLFTYLSGTSTPVSTYSESTLSSANANPIILPSDGRATIFLTPSVSYKFVLAIAGDTTPPSSPIWSVDGVSAVPPAGSATDTDVLGTAGETLAAGDAVAMSDGSGGGTAGRWYKADADLTNLSTAAQVVGFATVAISTGSSGTIRRGGRITGLAGLTAGTTYYISATAGALTSTGPTNARAILQADSTTAGIVLTGEPYASTTLQGVVSIGAQTLAGVKTFSGAPVFQALPTGLGMPVFARLASNFTKNNSVTLADVTALSFTVAANETWAFEVVVFGVSTVAADWKFDFTGPAAPTAVFVGVTGSMDLPTTSAVNAFSSAFVAGAGGVQEQLIIRGLLRNGANAGTVQLQAAQNTLDVSTTTIFAESYLIAWRLN